MRSALQEHRKTAGRSTEVAREAAGGASCVHCPGSTGAVGCLAVQAPAAAICEWSARRLSVPPGHPDEGSPFVIPDYGQKFLADVYDPEILESLLCLARKQGKSAIVAVLILAHLSDDGPLRRRGWRAGVVSISKLKAGELKLQAQQIAEAAGLKGLHFWRSPAPGRPGCRRPHRWEPSRPVYAAWLIFSCSVVKIAK